MSLTAKWFGLAQRDQYGATSADRIDWVNDTHKVALLLSTIAINQDTNRYWSDCVAYEASGAGYTAGGLALTTKTLSYDAGTKTTRLRCDPTTFLSVTLTDVRYAIIYKATGVDATSHLMGYADLGEAISPSNEDMNLEWDQTDGALRVLVIG